MSEIAVDIHSVSKKYTIGDTSSGSLKETIASFFTNNANQKTEEFWAIKDVSFKVGRGEAVGIIGKNGAGKSTLLKVLSRITEPTEGKIIINGRVSSLLEVGTGFHQELTGRENVFLNGTILGMSRAEVKAKFDEIAEFSGVQKFLDTPVKRYSSGMKVRLAFAVAAHLDPEILIIDEVLAVGDAEFQKKCLGKMQDVTGEGRTIIFVSHNMGAVRDLCTSGVYLKNGKVAKQGKIDPIISDYLTEGGEAQGNHTWDIEHAPGENGIKILQVGISSPHSEEVSTFTTEEELKLNFSILTEMDTNTHLDVTFHLADEMGNVIFTGSTARIEKENRLAKGLLKATCTIPDNLLNEGKYYISRLLVVKNRGTVLYEHNDLLSFEIIRPINNTFGWKGKKEGLIRPKLDWNVIIDEGKFV
ncbi:ABC transporter ATP-binding protein [Catalinimonas alkaloidigena]|uniref:ABC transporter ATP-binding protein n=1 Tax=Catalinimonas alkaloidigena TaxID=1075417 RepID=UPI002407304B|nr:ABC transporter ATP-binding protein [Catalinimonas alkaloidigena]